MKKDEQLKRNLDMFWTLFKLGFFTFGGGFSLLAQMQSEFVEKRKWLKEEELLNITSMARSVPGIMIANATVMVGYQIGGVSCAIFSLMGIVTPSIIIMAFVTILYEQFYSNPYVSRALSGIQCAVIPIIGGAALSFKKSALKTKSAYVIFFIALGLSIFTDINLVFIVIAGGLLGVLSYQLEKRILKK